MYPRSCHSLCEESVYCHVFIIHLCSIEFTLLHQRHCVHLATSILLCLLGYINNTVFTRLDQYCCLLASVSYSVYLLHQYYYVYQVTSAIIWQPDSVKTTVLTMLHQYCCVYQATSVYYGVNQITSVLLCPCKFYLNVCDNGYISLILSYIYHISY